MTSAQCIDHPYFHETLPHLQQTPPLPRIPFSQGQPLHRVVVSPIHDLTAPPRQVPPSHSHHEPRPAFANGDMRTLPPPIGTPDHNKNIFAGPDSYEPSALVNQLRQLDLPTEDLASYGHRPPPSPVASSVYTFGGDATVGRTRAWAEQQGPSRQYDAHYAHMNQSQAKVAAFVEQQQQVDYYEDGTPRQTGPGPLPPMPPIPPMDSPAASNSKLGSLTVGSKKKWGLSSVLWPCRQELATSCSGGRNMGTSVHLALLALLPSSELNQVADPVTVIYSLWQLSNLQPLPRPPSDDPKKAKKEAELARREADKAKREAMARKQKERARAVMMKRQQMVDEAVGSKDPQLEHHSGFTVAPESKPNLGQGSLGQHSPVSRLHQSSSRDLRQTSAHPMSQSATSVRSHESRRSAPQSLPSGHSQSHPSLPLREPLGPPSRHKARRRDEDDDHSMSSFDHNSLRSRSVLTVGTIDSE